jgi:PKD repeat protein
MDRRYGSSVLLSLTPADNYKPRVMIFGGGNPATATTEIIDLSGTSPQWVYGPFMSRPRTQMNATILPNGKVLALGGSATDEDATTASLNADLYDPHTNTFSSAGQNAFPRLYHSVSLLLPDATVWFAGSNPKRGSYEQHMEIYSPPYLFTASGGPATRPTITNIPLSVGFGAAFQIQTPDAAAISSIALVRPGSPTHAFDQEQRLVNLSFTVGSGVLNVRAPPNGNVAPPGYYLLFILNSSGVPAVAKFVQLTSTPADQPPTATITSPASDVAITAGQSVFFSGSGSDPDGAISAYSWSFPGGNPSSSNLANPGNVIYSTPGTYVASLTVTDNAGLTSPPATRTITVNSAPSSTWRDDFSSSTLDPSWSFAGVGNYSLTANPGHLQMNVPAGSDHNCWNTTLGCPRMLRSVSNTDGIYETKIDGVNIGTAAQTYGIFLQQDDANFLRFEFWTNGSGVRPAAWKNIGGIGSNAIYGPVITLGSSNYLRVTRTGSTFQLDYSTNGTTWVTAGSFTQAGFSVNKAGLHVDNAGGSSAPATTANFNYFQIQ